MLSEKERKVLQLIDENKELKDRLTNVEAQLSLIMQTLENENISLAPTLAENNK